MLENLLFILESGICIFHYRSGESLDINENLVSGFLNAISQFTEETFRKSALDQINISNKKKIVIYSPSQDDKLDNSLEVEGIKMKIYAIVDINDYNPLVLTLVKKLYQKFLRTYKDYLERSRFHNTKKFEPFADEVTNIMDGKIYARTKKKNRISIILSILLIFFPLVVIGVALPNFGPQIDLDCLNIGLVVTVLFGFIIITDIILIITGIIGGYISGSRRGAFNTGIKLTVIIFIALSIIAIRNGIGFFIVIIIIIVYFSLILIGSYYIGGFLRDKNYLYPM